MDTRLTIRRVSLLDVALFATQFRALIAAGIPINQTLAMLRSSVGRPAPALADALA